MSEGQFVAIVDDDDGVLDALTALLKRRGFQVDSMPSADAILAALDAGSTYACIVSDIRMPGMSGPELHEEIKKRGVTTPVIFVTGHGDVNLAVKSMKSGAHDFIEKPIDGGMLIASVRDAIQRYKATRDADSILSNIRERYAALSDRQREVMLLVANGHPNKEIAAILEISSRTVEHYRESVMERMGARNLADLVKMAIRLDILASHRGP